MAESFGQAKWLLALALWRDKGCPKNNGIRNGHSARKPLGHPNIAHLNGGIEHEQNLTPVETSSFP